MSNARPRWSPAYVGIGSNLDSPLDHVRKAITELAELPNSALQRVSNLYRSAPIGPPGQDDYINAVAIVLTKNEPQDFLVGLRKIEDRHCRDRSVERWGPRTLDLDLLVFAGVRTETTDLLLPHPRIAERNFVLLPLAELAPDLMVPGVGTVTKLARSLAESDAGNPRIEKISSSNP
ncbi:MAG: 2-amino-4-hydroxy-6-hydroxymethyldihydropteridine diphosphokinase [Gammaproteobacteria bacterium]|nr:2-amino-4-hydroxy-6-hydroxymethyldihydropteridine diphosphokinase [Gammaproteobacteria bacterium]